jgi:phosphatidylglycerol:prolipoprotein diacylglycerol transferase
MHPILLKTPFFNIYSYGFLVALGYAVGMFITIREVKKEGLNAEAIFDMLLIQLVVGILGSRLLFVVEYTPDKLSLSEFLNMEQGGLTFYGSVLISFIFNLLYLKFRKIPFWKVMDCIGFGLPLGIAIARVGCFLNGCCYGHQCSPSIGFRSRLAGSGYYHATQLYETAFTLFIFALVHFHRKHRKSYGETFLITIGLYGFFRFFIEFLRAENPQIILGLTLSQGISLITLSAVIATWRAIHRTPELRIIPTTKTIKLSDGPQLEESLKTR